MASIRGSAELLEGPAGNDPAARAKFLTNIQSEVERLNRIVTELLRLSRIETHKIDDQPSSIDAAAVCREVSEIYQNRAADCAVAFESKISSDPLPVRIDPSATQAAVDKSIG